MKYRIGIVEDNKENANVIISYLNKFQFENNIIFEYKYFSDGIEITSNYECDYDIIILDIEMEIQNGIKTAEIIREYDKEVIIIFVTNMSQYAIKGYEFNALSFLLKPVSYFSFKSEIEKSIDRIRQNKSEKYLLIPSTFGVEKLNSKDILYIESIKHDLIIHTVNNSHVFRATIKNYEKELSEYNFNRANNSYLINLKHVTGIEGDFALIGEIKLKISRGRKKQFMEELTKYIGEVR